MGDFIFSCDNYALVQIVREAMCDSVDCIGSYTTLHVDRLAGEDWTIYAKTARFNQKELEILRNTADDIFVGIKAGLQNIHRLDLTLKASWL